MFEHWHLNPWWVFVVAGVVIGGLLIYEWASRRREDDEDAVLRPHLPPAPQLATVTVTPTQKAEPYRELAKSIDAAAGKMRVRAAKRVKRPNRRKVRHK